MFTKEISLPCVFNNYFISNIANSHGYNRWEYSICGVNIKNNSKLTIQIRNRDYDCYAKIYWFAIGN